MKKVTLEDAKRLMGKYGTVLQGKAHRHDWCIISDTGTVPRHAVISKCDCGAKLSQVTVTDRYGEEYIERVTEASGREWRVSA